jgi:hypothetical protein
MSFTIIKLAGDRALVKGRDAVGTYGQQILDAAEWNDFNAHNQHNNAHEAFDAAVEAFFAPLSEAVDALKATAKPKQDPLFFVTVQEKSEAVAGTDEVLVRLSHDSAVLRLVEQDPDTARLLWVNDTLEILELEDPDNGQAGTPISVFHLENEAEYTDKNDGDYTPETDGEDEDFTKA